MYGPKWPFLLMYGSHDMRQAGFPQVDGLSTNPRDLRRHTFSLPLSFMICSPNPQMRGPKWVLFCIISLLLHFGPQFPFYLHPNFPLFHFGI